MTVNEAVEVVEQAIRLRGLNIHKINRLEIINAAQELVKAQGNDPTGRTGKVIAFIRDTQR